MQKGTYFYLRTKSDPTGVLIVLARTTLGNKWDKRAFIKACKKRVSAMLIPRVLFA